MTGGAVVRAGAVVVRSAPYVNNGVAFLRIPLPPTGGDIPTVPVPLLCHLLPPDLLFLAVAGADVSVVDDKPVVFVLICPIPE
jgi:hypothetical protein